MSLLSLLDAQLAFGHVALLDHANFSLEEGERVGLIGRNGTGKSSLLRILAAMDRLDAGQLVRKQGITAAYVAQEPVLDDSVSVFQAVQGALAGLLELIESYSAGRGELDQIQSAIESQDGWNWQQRVEETLARLRLDPQIKVGALSGGTRKRVALAQALVLRPDVLLLDEPTNHLDLDSILWLEELLRDFRGSVVLITHDRSFLDRVCTRIVELDRGQLRSFPGRFSTYRAQRDDQLLQEAVLQAKADKLLAQEEIWIRRGVEARRTRAQGRIVRLERLRALRASRRDAVGRVRMDVSSGLPSGKLVAEFHQVSKSFGSRRIVQGLDTTILRGDKLGLIGPNGAGKTTLLRLILGELEPDSGRVKRGTQLSVAYFDQMRDALDPDATLEDFISPGSEWIEIGTQKKHVRSYLSDFLFAPERAQSPVRSLSGGERNRLLLARLFARPANVLVLDEPTNDLDIETLELLEELLQNYEGTVFLVSHDRSFLDNVVTCTLAYEGEGLWREFEGGVQDWLLQSERARNWAAASTPGAAAGSPSKALSPAAPVALQAPASPVVPGAKRKLSYKEQRELEALPGLIDALELEQGRIQLELASGEIYRQDPARAAQLAERSVAIEDELMQALERWEALGDR